MVKSALLVIGIQDFNYGNINDDNYKNKVIKFLEYARLIFNSDEIIHINGSYIGSQFYKIINKYNKKKICYNSKQSQWINRKLDEPVFIKTNINVSNIGLIEYLLKNKIKKIYIIGLYSSLCINFNAIELSSRNFEVIVLSKYCSDINKNAQNFINNDMIFKVI
tara:strand:+ start:563 stop:1054 length:492 start_codon:yes stop_codon:yes gene_type:complete